MDKGRYSTTDHMLHEYEQNHLVNLILKVTVEGKMHTTSNKISMNSH